MTIRPYWASQHQARTTLRFQTKGHTMLVLSRKPKESVHVGPEIRVTVIRITGDKVRIGIEAPKTLNVWRNELGPMGSADVAQPGTRESRGSAAWVCSSAVDKVERAWQHLTADEREAVITRIEKLASNS